MIVDLFEQGETLAGVTKREPTIAFSPLSQQSTAYSMSPGFPLACARTTYKQPDRNKRFLRAADKRRLGQTDCGSAHDAVIAPVTSTRPTSSESDKRIVSPHLTVASFKHNHRP